MRDRLAAAGDRHAASRARELLVCRSRIAARAPDDGCSRAPATRSREERE